MPHMKPVAGIFQLNTCNPYLYTALVRAVEGTCTNTRFLPHISELRKSKKR